MGTVQISLDVGLQYVPLAIGIYFSFFVLSLPDLTIEGAFGLGGATSAVALSHGTNPALCVALGVAAGAAAGATTGIIHVFMRVNTLLASILVSAACWSLALMVMNGGNVSLFQAETVFDLVDGIPLVNRDVVMSLGLLATALSAGIVFWLLHTQFGASLRATGMNIQSARMFGIRTETRQIVGLAIANGLVGASAALVVQQQGFMDVSIQAGVLVVGIASLVIGKSIISSDRIGLALAGAVIGVVVYRYVVALTFDLGWSPFAVRLITASLVLAVIVARGHAPLYRHPFSREGRELRQRVRLEHLESDKVAPIL